MNRNGVYHILVLDDRVWTQTMVGGRIVHALDQTKTNIANEDASDFALRFAENLGGTDRAYTLHHKLCTARLSRCARPFVVFRVVICPLQPVDQPLNTLIVIRI